VVIDGAASEGGPIDLAGMVFEGRFRVDERIAEGGFAIVYKAYQVALDRWVALKVLKAPRGHDERARAEFRERFASEARTIARIQHPNIVEVYDFAVSILPSGEPAPWMALQWLDGETLATYLGRRRARGDGGLPPREAVDLLAPVLQALAHAHKQGIVHRDIKPANIMMTQTPRALSLRVLDFGIAKIMADDRSPDTGNTRTESAPAFSPAYAAPEQIMFSRTGPWTDVHALGLILSELMTGSPPFADPDPEAHTFEQIMSPRRPTPASKGRDAGAFEPVIAKALALIPRERWKNAGDLWEALEKAPLNVPVTGSAPEPANPSVPAAGQVSGRGPALRRRTGLVAAVALGGFASIVGLGWRQKTRTQAGYASRPMSAAPALTEAPLQPNVLPGLPLPPAAANTAAPAANATLTDPLASLATAATSGPKAKKAPSRRKNRPVDPPPKPPDRGTDLFDDTK
jgi:serine/threonine protein kinase